jgi:hypothetical protein
LRARDAPTAVVLEHIHHADRDSLLLLEWVAREVTAWRLALVATYARPAASRPAIRETLSHLAREPACERFASGATRAPATHKERAMFRREGEYWTIAFEDRVVRLHDSRGLRCLAMLLTRPQQAIHVRLLFGAGSRRGVAAITNDTAAVERARVAVTKAIKAALARIAVAHPALGRHLEASVRRGRRCTYQPDPRRPIAWDG